MHESFGKAFRISIGYNQTRDVNMDLVSVNQFRGNLKTYIERNFNTYATLKLTRKAEQLLLSVSTDDLEEEQESLCVSKIID
jgi:PHD/YefM family antitoxin component YafN of YafNO toxin-antitoxin module